MKWGTVQLVINMVVWSLLIVVIVHHIDTRPQTKRTCYRSRSYDYSRPRGEYNSRRMVARDPISRPLVKKIQEPSIDLEEVESWPLWLQDKYRDEIEAKRKSMRSQVGIPRPCLRNYDQLSDLVWGALDERMKKKEAPCTESFRAGRGKRRDVTGGVMDDVANVLVNYKKQNIAQQKKLVPVNREFVQELSQSYKNRAYLRMEE